MPSANSDVILASCPQCGAAYDFPSSMAGRKGRCAKCNAAFSVPTPKPADVLPADMPEFIGVDCHLCGTRLYGRPEHIGKKLKCPDCNARTVLPPPPPPKKKDIPEAMYGEQYELLEPDAPRPKRVAPQPKHIAVDCFKCDTIIYATEEQVGKRVSCPVCGAKHVVPEPAQPKPTKSVLAPDSLTPMIDVSADPGERPVHIPPRAKMEYEDRQEAEYARALEESRRTGKPMKIDSRGRPVIPRYPLLTGVLPYFFAPGVAVFWLGLSGGFFAALGVLLSGIQAAAGGNPVAGMCLFAAGSILTTVVSAAASSFFLTVVSNSSEGSDLIEGATYIFDWFGDLLLVLVGVMASAFPGWLVAKFLIPDPLLQTAVFAGGIVLCLPVVLLSQLDIGSPWGILSPRVVGSLFRCPCSWLTFYVETGLLGAGCVALAWFLGEPMKILAALAPLGTAVLVVYGRLLGRLGWRLAEAMPILDE